MKYLKTKKDSLEEAISKAINEKPEQLKEEVVAKDLLEAGGKYLKYSDLLLQKGRLMAKGKNTAMIDKEISKEMKKLGIKEGSDEYEKFFQSALKKFKIDSPADLKTDDKKKEFFNYIDKNYKAKEEESDLEETTTKDVDETLDKIREANVAKGKSMRSILADIWKMNEGKNPFEKTVKESPFDSKRQLKDPKKETMVMMKKGNYKGQVFVIDKKDLPKFERQGGIQVENKDEGFASDAQRRAAFASGYKEKGKKKKEEVEKSSKTATGQKPTKVEIEPEVK